MRAVLMVVSLLWGLAATSVQAEEPLTCGSSSTEGFSNIQIETADITLHERLFELVFHAPSLQRLDHPQTDLIRIYCLRDVVVRSGRTYDIPVRPDGYKSTFGSRMWPRYIRRCSRPCGTRPWPNCPRRIATTSSGFG